MGPKELLEEALRLTPEARVALANEILDSVGGVDDADPDAETAWAEEIKRRVDELKSGKVKGVPWSEVQRRALETLKKTRAG